MLVLLYYTFFVHNKGVELDGLQYIFFTFIELGIYGVIFTIWVNTSHGKNDEKTLDRIRKLERKPKK